MLCCQMFPLTSLRFRQQEHVLTSIIFESFYACSLFRVTLQAPRHSSASRMPSGGGGGALRVPRVLCPLAPLDRIELPQRGIFGPTLPVPTVGRSDEDGGMPRSISPYRAWVVPPLSLSAACAGRIAAAVCASPGGITTTVTKPLP